jgi:peroxiredoxin
MKKLILASLFLIAFPVFSNAQDDGTLTKVGDKAPVFSCTTLDGKIIDLSKTNGKIVMVTFFATWCGPCNEELPVLQKEIYEKYKNNPNFVLAVIGRQHTEQELKDFAAAKGLSLPFAADPKKDIYSLYAKQMIPRNFIIGKDGKILLQEIGFFPDDFNKLKDLLAKELN